MTGDITDPLRPWSARPKHLQRFTDKRTGRVHVYFRFDGMRRAMRSPWGTQALADEAAAATASVLQRQRPAVGTLVGAIKAYRGDTALGIKAAADFLVLEPSTQKEYERWLDKFEVIFAGVLLSDIDAGFVLEVRNKLAARGYRAANIALQLLKNVCKEPMIRGEIEGDPFAKIDKVKRPAALGEPNPRWEDDEVDAVIDWAIARDQAGLARAVALGRWGGFRRASMCALPRRARILRRNAAGEMERRLLWVTEKKRVLCDRREDPRLTALLARTESMLPRDITALTVACNSRGESWKPRALDQALARALAALAREGKVRDTLTPHGLRHARGVELASNGASDAEIMAQLDHATPRAAQIYRRQAERLQLADAAQDRVDAQIVRLAAKRAANGAGTGTVNASVNGLSTAGSEES